MEQRVVVGAGHQHDVATAASVAAAGAAAGDEFLTPERKTAVPAVAGLHEDFYFVDEQLNCQQLLRYGFGDVGMDVDELAHAPAIAEFNDPGDLGEQSVVLAAADVHAGFDLGAA